MQLSFGTIHNKVIYYNYERRINMNKEEEKKPRLVSVRNTPVKKETVPTTKGEKPKATIVSIER